MKKEQLAIIGIGETTYSSNSGLTGEALLLQATTRAVRDAGLRMKDIDGIIIPREMSDVRPYELEFQTGMNAKFKAYAMMESTAGVIHAMEMAQAALAAGMGKHYLIYSGANQASASQSASPRNFHMHDRYKRNLEFPMGFHPQPVYFAAWKRRYSALYGDCEPALAAICVNQRRHALLNGNSQMKKPLSVEDYYRSPLLAEPLRLLDCCLITDSAAALVVSSMETAKALPRPTGRPLVPVLGLATAATDPVSPYCFHQTRPEMFDTAAGKCVPLAMSMAGIQHDDIDVMEMYDCFSITVLREIEDCGFCGIGEGIDFIGDGSVLSLEGKFPLNTHGGQLSRGYSWGMCHVLEATKQMRGEAARCQIPGAKTAFVGGYGAWQYGCLILGRD